MAWLSCSIVLGQDWSAGDSSKLVQCCPEARYQERNLDFRLIQVSDCAIISAEVSPAGVINLLWHSWRAVFQLMEHGIMTRGYVKVGLIYHTDKHVIGSGYHEALAAEK